MTKKEFKTNVDELIENIAKNKEVIAKAEMVELIENTISKFWILEYSDFKNKFVNQEAFNDFFKSMAIYLQNDIVNIQKDTIQDGYLSVRLTLGLTSLYCE